ncbi:13635_t:CDS:2 [Racocetra fulgida]|uniref:HECT-type E3 ubiquitin transferase n=1 Tax=Racocetra fulgida TaxID=60492 RepID=A0A9N9A9U5_9GLOM|nr:13635_t:CDS:2 [Racocetra fulgida]
MFSLEKQNAEKQAFVDKARSEREKRELQRVKQKQEQEHAQAADMIQTAFKKHCKRKKDIKHLRELWDIDVLYTSDNGSNSTFSISSTEVLGFSYLMFAFFNPSDDAKDLSRFSHLCKMILSTITPSTPAKSQTQEASQSVVPFHSLLLNERYKALMLKIMKKILWQCVICVTGSLNETSTLNSSKPLYLSGPELRLLIYFLDPKNYIVKGTISSYSSMWNQQLVMLHDYLIHQGFCKQIGYGIMLRVNSILSFQSRAAKAELMDNDKKLLKSTQLWLIACLRCCLFPLDLNNEVDMTLRSFKMSQNNLQDQMFKTYNILSRVIHTMCIPDIAVKILQIITGNDTIFLTGNMVELMSRIDILSLPDNKIFLSETVVKEPEKEPLIGILDNSPPDGNPPTIFESARRVLLQLHLRDTRRVFTGHDHTWLLIKDPKISLPLSLANFLKKSYAVNPNNSMGTSFLERIRNNDPISVKILNLLPHTIPFETRLDIFREFLQTDDSCISDWSDTVIKIRRDHVLEDGYKQLGKLTATKIKGRIRVMFVNETGMDEIGVDQGGPFKEFITQLISEAFDPKCGLFAVTPDGTLYPNPHSASTKLPLYTFLGRMIARAMKEKILLDYQFAEFFLSKISGRAVFLEDLIGWNNELWKNLIFLKRYEGLYFVIDEEINGQIKSKELKSVCAYLYVQDLNLMLIYLQPQFTIRMVSMEYDDSESRPVLAPVKAFFSFGNSKSAAKGRLPTSSTW